MAATSPYVQNDYQSQSNFRPYQLSVNDVFKGLSAQNEFWDKGAERIKNVYDNALNLRLSIEENKQIRDKFMEDAKKQLVKISSMNVADPSIQRKGFGIFKPLLSDEGIIYDDLTTRHYDQVRSDALAARSKGKGEGYSDVNLAYAMDGYGDFINSKDRMAGKKFYENRKEYTPYYDVTGDYFNALSKCKPNKVNSNSLQGLYTYNLSEESLDPNKVNSCVQAGMSEKARTQLRIEGSVNYKNQKGALASEYLPYLISLQKSHSTNVTNYQAEMQGKIKAGTLSDEDKGYYDEMISKEKLLLLNNQKDIDALSSGDYSPIEKDYEQIAYAIHAKNSTQNFANAFSYLDSDRLYKSDAAAIAKFTQGQLNYRQDDQQDFEMTKQHDQQQFDMQRDMSKALYSTESKLSLSQRIQLSGRLGVDPLSSMVSVLGTAEEKGAGWDIINNYLSTATKDKENALDNLLGVAKKSGVYDQDIKGGDYAPVVRAINKYIEQFKGQPDKAKADPNYGQMIEYYNDWLDALSREKNLKSTIDDAEAQAKKESPDLFTTYVQKTDKLFRAAPDRKLTNGEVISGLRLRSILENRDPEYSLYYEEGSPGYTSSDGITYGAIAGKAQIVDKKGNYMGNIPEAVQFNAINSEKETNYLNKVKQILGPKMASAGLVYLAPQGAEQDLVDRMKLMGPDVAKYTSGEYIIEAGKYDPTTGDVQPLIFKKNAKNPEEKGDPVPFEFPKGTNIGGGIIKEKRGELYINIPTLQVATDNPTVQSFKITGSRLSSKLGDSNSAELFKTWEGSTIVLTVDKPRGKSPIYRIGFIPVGQTTPNYNTQYQSTDLNAIATKASILQKTLNNRSPESLNSQ